MAQVLELAGRLDDEDSPTREVMNSCKILSVEGTSLCSTRYCRTIYALQIYMMESKPQNRTMACRLCTTVLGLDNNICAWFSEKTFRCCIVERKLMT